MSSNEYMRLYMLVRRHTRRDDAIARLGGKCVRCGTTAKLEFDHIDPSTKINSIANLLNGSLEKLTKEVDKCQLLCHRCHLIKSKENGDPTGGGHNRIDNPKHGTAKMYGLKCKCSKCYNWKREYREKRVDSLGNIQGL